MLADIREYIHVLLLVLARYLRSIQENLSHHFLLYPLILLLVTKYVCVSLYPHHDPNTYHSHVCSRNAMLRNLNCNFRILNIEITDNDHICL